MNIHPELAIFARISAVELATQELWNTVDRLIDEEALTVAEACKITGVSRATLYRRLHEYCTTAYWPEEAPK